MDGGIEDNWISSPDHCVNWTDGTTVSNGQFGIGNTISNASGQDSLWIVVFPEN